MPLIFSIFSILLISFFFSRLAKKVHLSEVIGLIVAGLILSTPLLKQNIIVGHEDLMEILAYAGLFCLMFLAGFEVSWSMLVKEEKDSIIVTIFTISTSLILGTSVLFLFGFSLTESLIMGICFGITAEATKARALIQLNKLKTKLGSLLMGAGIINDIIGASIFTIIVYISTKSINTAEMKILAGTLLAFFLGAAVHYIFDRFSESIKIIEKWLLILVVPFLFVNMGINFSWIALKVNYLVLLLVIIIATSGQLLGTFLTKPITKLRPKQLWLVGWGMNSKGAVEIAIAFIALQIGLLSVVLYSSLIVTALVTTIFFQIIIFRMVRKNPAIMD